MNDDGFENLIREGWEPLPIDEKIAALLAHHIAARFDQIMGAPLLCSPLVYLAAKQTLQVFLAEHNEDDVLRALKEFLQLEDIGTPPQVPRPAPGGGGG